MSNNIYITDSVLTEANISIVFNSDTGTLAFSRINMNDPAAFPDYSLENTDFLEVLLPWHRSLQIFGEQRYLRDITQRIIIEEGITRIGTYAFYGFSNVSMIELPSSICSIGFNAFDLTPDKTNKLILTVTFKGDIFSWCNIDFNCVVKTTSNTLTALKTNPLFLASNFLYDGVKSNGEQIVLDFCESIKPNLAESDQTNALLELVIKDFAFVGYPNLTTLIFSSTTTTFKSITIGDYAFYGCVDLGPELDFSKDSYYYIGDRAFSNCSNLAIVSIPDTVLILGFDVFEACPKLNCYLQLKNPSILADFDGTSIGWHTNWNYSLSSSNIHLGYKRSGITVDQIIWKKSFEDKIYIVGYQGTAKSLNIPASLEDCPIIEIGYNAFAGAHFTKLTINLASHDLLVKKSAFFKCLELEEVLFTPLEGSSQIEIEDFVFADCSALHTVVFDTKINQLGVGVFKGCTSLKSIKLPKVGNYSIQDVYESNNSEGMLLGYALVEPVDSTTKNVYYFHSNISTDSKDDTHIFFTNCNILDYACFGEPFTHIILQNIPSIGKSAFESCAKLQEVVIDFYGKTSKMAISESAFKDCSSLTKVSLTDSFTELKEGFVNEWLSRWCNIEFCNAYSNPLYYDAYEDYTIVIDKNISIPTTVIPKSLWCKTATIDDSTTKQYFISGQLPEITTDNNNLLETLENAKLDNITCIPSCTFLSSYIKTLTVPDTELVIGDFAFAKSALESIKLSKSSGEVEPGVSSEADLIEDTIKTCYIGQSAFFNTQLSTLKIITDEKTFTLQNHAFSQCHKLKELELNIPKDSSIIVDSFVGLCDNLETLTVPARMLFTFNLKSIATLSIIADGSSLTQDSFITAKNLKSLLFDISNDPTLFVLLENINGLSFMNSLHLAEISVKSAGTGIKLSEVAYFSDQNCLLKRISKKDDTLKTALVFGANSATPASISDTYNVYQIQNYAFYNRKFTTVSLPQTVERVGKNLFTYDKKGAI